MKCGPHNLPTGRLRVPFDDYYSAGIHAKVLKAMRDSVSNAKRADFDKKCVDNAFWLLRRPARHRLCGDQGTPSSNQSVFDMSKASLEDSAGRRRRRGGQRRAITARWTIRFLSLQSTNKLTETADLLDIGDLKNLKNLEIGYDICGAGDTRSTRERSPFPLSRRLDRVRTRTTTRTSSSSSASS